MRYTLSLAVALAAALALTPSPVRGEGGVRGTPPPDAQDIVLLAQGRPYLIRLAVTVDGKPYSARFDAYLKQCLRTSTATATAPSTAPKRVTPHRSRSSTRRCRSSTSAAVGRRRRRPGRARR